MTFVHPTTGAVATRVSFIIPVKNDAKRLKRCLESIAQNRTPAVDIEMIVADNGSTDDSREVAAALGARVLHLPGLRVSDLRNQAAAATTGSILAFVDADHEIVPAWSASAIDTLETSSVGAVGALYSSPKGGSWVQRMYGALRGQTIGRHEVGWLGSGNLAVRRTAFEAIGGFDRTLEACEDVDFCQRLTGAGWRILGDERLESIHFGDPATLSALFRAERWRGRNNIQVSLRGPLKARDLPSVVIPLVDLAAVAVIVAGIVALPAFQLRTLALVNAAALLLVGLSLLRASRIIINDRPFSPLGAFQALLVALTYDVARAIALVTRARHHRHAAAPVRSL